MSKGKGTTVRIPGLSGGSVKRKALVLGMVALALYLIVRDPIQAASSVQDVGDALGTFVHGLGGGA